MATQNIPAKKIVTCDGCGKSNQEVNMDCSIVVQQTYRDYQGGAVAGGKSDLDFCTTCAQQVIDAINSAVKTIKG